MTDRLLLDHSAWARLEHHALSPARSAEITAALQAGTLVTCLPFILEVGYSARGAKEHDRLIDLLLALPRFHVDAVIENRALAAQRQLARVGHHRLPPADLMIAALADHHELGVLHYDADYDILAEKTDLSFDSVWLAERGSL